MGADDIFLTSERVKELVDLPKNNENKTLNPNTGFR